jgi:hypothetical protein
MKNIENFVKNLCELSAYEESCDFNNQHRDYDYRVVDGIGGTHEDGLGWDPDGSFCGECTNMDCKTCPVWLNKHSK